MLVMMTGIWVGAPPPPALWRKVPIQPGTALDIPSGISLCLRASLNTSIFLQEYRSCSGSGCCNIPVWHVARLLGTPAPNGNIPDGNVARWLPRPNIPGWKMAHCRSTPCKIWALLLGGCDGRAFDGVISARKAY